MKSHKRIFIAFILNLVFSLFEFIGGIFTGSVAILSDSLHDLGDASSIGISYLFEKKSSKEPDDNYTYGYQRYSVLGSLVMTLILIMGSVIIIYNAVTKLLNPTPINHDGMIVLALVGITVNFIATLVTREGHSLNEKAVTLHMLEDVLGWAVVLVGAVIIKFTGITLIDPLLSICVAVFVLINAIRTLTEALSVFLEKAPKSLNVKDIKLSVAGIEGVLDVHHIHLWSIDGTKGYATMHIVTDKESNHIKDKIKDELRKHGINH
ncbi:MAG: cation transporter, partial [Ruminococcus sp.]|nr:cation transporter [Ruminococcus sp.]